MVGEQYLVPFILITSLFFLWGFAHAILDVLNKHFQELLDITKAHSAFIQAMMYMGYFVMAVPAGLFISRFGYRRGVVFGLLLYGIGSLLFIPGQYYLSFNMFLFALFVIGCGLTFLETAANPYATELGAKETAASRLNFAHGQEGDLLMARPVADADGICGYLFFDLMDEQIYEAVRECPLDDVVITDRYDNLVFAVGRQNADPMEKYPAGKYRMDWQKGNIVKVNNKHYHIHKEVLPESSLILYTLVSMEFQRSLVTYGILFLGLAGILMVIMIPPLTLRITKKNLQAIDELQASVEEMGRGISDYRLKARI